VDGSGGGEGGLLSKIAGTYGDSSVHPPGKKDNVLISFVPSPVFWLVGGLELPDDFSIQLGMSSSQLTFTPSFFRGVGQPPTRWLLKDVES